MKYEIKGGSFPIVECTLDKDEFMITESGSMCWRDENIEMKTSSNGGLGKVIGRIFTREKLFQNIFTAKSDGAKIAFGTCVPGSIMPIVLDGTNSLICQKSAFLASYGDIELSTFFNKKFGVGLFGGEGFIMQKITGKGIVFLEIDGASFEVELAKGEKKILNTGYLVSMDETCSIDIESVGGLKNIFLGGQGIFNTTVTGPGKIVMQSMPISKLASSIDPYITRTTTTVSTSSSSSD